MINFKQKKFREKKNCNYKDLNISMNKTKFVFKINNYFKPKRISLITNLSKIKFNQINFMKEVFYRNIILMQWKEFITNWELNK